MIVGGRIRVPGDKSLTHRALFLAALAPGSSVVHGALDSLDARSTARVLRRLGAAIDPLRAGRPLEIRGRERFRRPTERLHCGNSGTTSRLLLGLLAAHDFSAILTGDASLRRRPMRRVTAPLALMGARFVEHAGDGLPLTIRGGALRPLAYQLPVSSAQIKSCLLLAGMAGGVEVKLREPQGSSRDHTERMLRAFGYAVTEEPEGWIRFAPTGRLTAFEMRVPGDISSAAFPLGVAVLAEGGELVVSEVGLNPTRIGFLRVLERMGARPQRSNQREEQGEPVGDLRIGPATLQGTVVAPREIPGVIDEIPLLAVLASRAQGETVFRGAGELRVKESDRLTLLAANLRAVGVRTEVVGDDLHIEGTGLPPRGRVRTAGDHRLAMAFAVLGTVPGARVSVDDMACAAVSYPGFGEMLKAIRVRAKR